jgi:hypothetical protein
MRRARLLLFSLSALLLPRQVDAQWRTQMIYLRPGWNAVHLEVKPAPGECDALFASLPVESVWKWNRRFSAIQFVTDPAALLPEDPDWLVWLPVTDERSFLRRLHSLQAGQCYLIKVANDASAFTLPIKGNVVLPRLEWFPHGLNLAGFPVNPVRPPTFSEFFESNPDVDTSRGVANELYRLGPDGRGIRIVQPNRDRIEPGVAYWVACRRSHPYASAIHITASGGGLDFGSVFRTKELVVRNTHPAESTTVQLHQRPSEPAPATGGHPEVAGPVPLSWLTRDPSNQPAWVAFPADGLSHTLGPGESWTLQLGVRRDEFASYTPAGTNSFAYQSILEVTDALESLLSRVPITAMAAPSSLASSESPGAYDENTGLWVGAAELNRVNAPAYTSDTVTPTPAPLPLRLIMHVDSSGNARLLGEVWLAWDPTLTDDPHTNGAYALYASDQALPESASQVKRISSVGFPVMPPVPLSGSLTNALSGTVNIPFDDPTNPFLHSYHPMHDNRDLNFTPYDSAVEVPAISRIISLYLTTATNGTISPWRRKRSPVLTPKRSPDCAPSRFMSRVTSPCSASVESPSCRGSNPESVSRPRPGNSLQLLNDNATHEHKPDPPEDMVHFVVARRAARRQRPEPGARRHQLPGALD